MGYDDDADDAAFPLLLPLPLAPTPTDDLLSPPLLALTVAAESAAVVDDAAVEAAEVLGEAAGASSGECFANRPNKDLSAADCCVHAWNDDREHNDEPECALTASDKHDSARLRRATVLSPHSSENACCHCADVDKSWER